jgi:dihydroxyacetone kinase
MIEELKELVKAIEDERLAVERMAEYIQSNNKLLLEFWEKKMEEATKRLDSSLDACKVIIREFPANTNLVN